MREISAGIIIYFQTKDGLKFLILYHGHGYWNFPKGKIETEEKSLAAAVREIREETGLTRNDLELKNPFKTHERFVFWRRLDNKNVRISKIVIFYLAQTNKNTIRVSEEHEGYGWFTYREALNILSRYKSSQKILKQANDFLRKSFGKPQIRVNSPARAQ